MNGDNGSLSALLMMRCICETTGCQDMNTNVVIPDSSISEGAHAGIIDYFGP